MFTGVIPILATPFHDDESLDLESWRRLLEFMVGLGVDGVTILGVLGESNRLNDDGTRNADRGRGVARSRKRVPIIVGTSAPGTRDSRLPVADGAGSRRRRRHGDAGERSRSRTTTACSSCISRSPRP